MTKATLEGGEEELKDRIDITEKGATMFEKKRCCICAFKFRAFSIFTAVCSTGVGRQYLLVVEVLNILDRLVHEARVNIG